MRTNAVEISAVISKAEQSLGRAVTEAEVADVMGITLSEYQQMLLDTNTSQIYSLDELQEENADYTEEPDERNEHLNPLNKLMMKTLLKQVSEAIGMLPEREQLLLNLYYQQELNMKEIGIILNLTETRISQLHSHAIKRLRARLDALNHDKQ